MKDAEDATADAESAEIGTDAETAEKSAAATGAKDVLRERPNAVKKKFTLALISATATARIKNKPKRLKQKNNIKNRWFSAKHILKKTEEYADL